MQTYGYNYLPDHMPLNKVILIIAHNAAQTKAYGWRYYQQLGPIAQQWNAGARGSKINLHWRRPISTAAQLEGKLEETLEGKKAGTLLKKARGAVGKVFGGKEKTIEPFIGLCHESDGKSNCFVSATIQKKGEIDKAIDLFKDFAQLLKNNPQDVAVIILENYLHQRSEANGALNYTDQEVDQKLDKIIEESGLAAYSYKLEKEPWPTIGKMRTSGKRLLIFNSKRPTKYTNDYHSNFNATHWNIDLLKDINAGVCKLTRNDTYQPNIPGFIVGNNYEQSISVESKKGKLLRGIQKVGIKTDTKDHIIGTSDYKIINSKDMINKRISSCEKRGTVTTLGLDMVEVGQAAAAVRDINMERIKEFDAEKQPSK